QQAHRLTRAAERQDEEARPAILARAAIADHRAVTVVHLTFFAGRRRDDDTRFCRGATAQLHDEAADARVLRRKPVVVDEVLPDGDSVAATRKRLGDDLAIRLAGARARGSARPWPDGVGGHPLTRNGRF